MRRVSTYILMLFCCTAYCTGCIKNDIPYPVIELGVTAIDVDGVESAPVIDDVNLTVTLQLSEQTDIQNVNIKSVTYSDHATPSLDIVGQHDMRTPLSVTLSLYQNYAWNIVAEQTISRSFTVEGQIGATKWNLAARQVTVYVGFDDRSNINVTSLKLAAADISTYEWAEGVDEKDFSSVRYVYVTCHGRTERWSLYVLKTDIVVDITQADAWGNVMWLYGSGLSNTTLGFKYRKIGEQEWTTATGVNVDGGTFDVCIGHLTPNTQYEVMAYSDNDVSAVRTLTTESITPLTNGNMEDWATIKKIVCPYLSDETAFWGTGNPGAATVSATVTDKDTDTPASSTGMYSAKLSSTYANLAGIGKFAAGNLFIGRYVATKGTNGIVGFGRPFTSRPLALKLYVKYNCGNIDRIGTVPSGSSLKAGDSDNGMIYIALGTWTPEEYGIDYDGNMSGTAESPLIVDTRDKSTFFNNSSKAIVAYGELPLTSSVSQWTEYTIKLKYTATNVVPTHIMIVCSASRWGDYFTGSTASTLWVDDMELVYDIE